MGLWDEVWRYLIDRDHGVIFAFHHYPAGFICGDLEEVFLLGAIGEEDDQASSNGPVREAMTVG